MRRIPGIAVAMAGALATLVAAPAVAQAATPPVVNWAHSVEDDLGTLEVAAEAEAGVTSLRAHIRKYGVEPDIAVVEDFELVSGTVQDGVWRTPAPVQLAEFDYYDVVVDVTDADGNVASGPGWGTLTYAVRTTFSPLRIDPPAVTYTDREVTVSGTLTGKRPDNREIVPVPGGAVSVASLAADGQPETVTTAGDGSFAATLVMTGPGDAYAEFGAEGYYMRATSEPASIQVSPTESRITIETSATEVEQGGQMTVSGQLTWLSPDDGWQPLAGAQIGLMHCSDALGYCPGVGEYPVTDADGRYSVVMTPWDTGTVKVGFPSRDPFIARADAQTRVVVWQPASFADFTASRDAAGDVITQGHMEFGHTTPWPVEVEIQFKRAGSRTWTTVATEDNAEWDGTGYLFTATVDQPRKGQWRAFFAGRPDLFRPVTTEPVFVR